MRASILLMKRRSRSGEPGLRQAGLRRGGFSLLEALVALVLIGLALLFTMSLLAQQPQIERRLTAHSEVLQVLGDLHETIRAGMRLSIGEQRLEWQSIYDAAPVLAAADNLVVWSTVERLEPEGLYRVQLKARYFVGHRTFDHVLETMVWRR